MMAELQEEYLQSFPEKYETMKTYFRNSEWYNLELEFHKLKGTGTTYGVPEVSELCEFMEAHCQNKGAIQEEDLLTSLTLLQKIREKYSMGKTYELSTDSQYLELKNS